MTPPASPLDITTTIVLTTGGIISVTDEPGYVLSAIDAYLDGGGPRMFVVNVNTRATKRTAWISAEHIVEVV